MRLLVLSFCLFLALGSAAAAQTAAARLGDLHDALHLTAGQEAAWRDYQAAIAPDPQAGARRRATEQLLPQLPTPRRIALVEAAMSQDLAEFRRQGEAVSGVLFAPHAAATGDLRPPDRYLAGQATSPLVRRDRRPSYTWSGPRPTARSRRPAAAAPERPAGGGGP